MKGGERGGRWGEGEEEGGGEGDRLKGEGGQEFRKGEERGGEEGMCKGEEAEGEAAEEFSTEQLERVWE